MDSNHVTVVYKWTAQPGKLDELTTIYKKVTDAMERNEPDAEAVHLYVSEDDNAVYKIVYQARGVVGGIAPWNFPISTVSGKILPATITGNTVVIKPSPCKRNDIAESRLRRFSRSPVSAERYPCAQTRRSPPPCSPSARRPPSPPAWSTS